MKMSLLKRIDSFISKSYKNFLIVYGIIVAFIFIAAAILLEVI